jgi:hypothetical protein
VVKTLSSALFLLLSLVLSAPVEAQPPVYPGCSVPPSVPRRDWYIDAVNGSDTTGTGSKTAPWQTLQPVVSSVNGASPRLSTIPYHHRDATGAWVVAPNPRAPIQPGDTIWLMSGNYGVISIGSYHDAVTNPEFVTIAAGEGVQAVLSTLFLVATNNWYFSGLTVRSLKTSADNKALVTVTDGGSSYSTSNIVFGNMTIESKANIADWSQAYWLANGREGFNAYGSSGGENTSCISMFDSHITNVTNGVQLFASQSMFTNNEIDHFGDDGLDYAASNLSITNNYIHDNNNLGDGNHEDAMQGQIGFLPAGAAVNYFSNILIDSNTIIRQVDPNLAYPTYLQGIDAFNEDWTNVTVTNNVIVTSACWGIVYASIHDSMIANNTVLNDGLIPMSGNCAPTVAIEDKTPESVSSSNSILRNNLANALEVYNLDPGVQMDHNVSVSTKGNGYLSKYDDGIISYFSAPGDYARDNSIDSGGVAEEFREFSPSTLTYNLELKSGAQAIGAGVATGAPTVNILGYTRTVPYNAGAY